MRKINRKSTLFTLLVCFIYACNSKQSNVDLNKEIVLKIAKDTAIKVYGNDVIQHELPLVAKLVNDSTWLVEGTLPEGWKGGTVYILISDTDKKVKEITHFK